MQVVMEPFDVFRCQQCDGVVGCSPVAEFGAVLGGFAERDEAVFGHGTDEREGFHCTSPREAAGA